MTWWTWRSASMEEEKKEVWRIVWSFRITVKYSRKIYSPHFKNTQTISHKWHKLTASQPPTHLTFSFQYIFKVTIEVLIYALLWLIRLLLHVRTLNTLSYYNRFGIWHKSKILPASRKKYNADNQLNQNLYCIKNNWHVIDVKSFFQRPSYGQYCSVNGCKLRLAPLGLKTY